MASKYEEMRTNPANWKLGFIYVCRDDPRIVVRQRTLFGWTWNFGNSWAFPTIILAALTAVGPLLLGWWMGVRSELELFLLLGAGFAVVVLMASRCAKDPAP